MRLEVPFKDVAELVSEKRDYEMQVSERGADEVVMTVYGSRLWKGKRREFYKKTITLGSLYNASCREIAFSQEWLDTRIAKPEFAKSLKHRTAMMAEKSKRVERKENKNV